MKHGRSTSPSSMSTETTERSYLSSASSSGTSNTRDKSSYKSIKVELKKANPAAIVLWAFHKLPSKNGLSSGRVIGFLKKHYKVRSNPRKTSKSFAAMLRSAVEFGLLQRRGNKYYLADKNR